jgi:cytochrome c
MTGRHLGGGIHAFVTGGLIWGLCASASAADLQRGELLFQTCAACHSVLGNGVGPDIRHVYGTKAASQPGFQYSQAMKESGLTWDEKTLRAFVTKPQAVVKGTAMAFPGYTNPADVGNVVAYLKSLR